MPEKPESVFSYLHKERVADRAVVVGAEDPFGALGYEVCGVNDERGQKVLSKVDDFYIEQIPIISYVNPLLEQEILRIKSLTRVTEVDTLSSNTDIQNFLSRIYESGRIYIEMLSHETRGKEAINNYRDETRRYIPSPRLVPLQKDQNDYVGVIYDDQTILVLGVKPILQLVGRYEILRGLEMQNYLVKGKNGGYLDLMSILPRHISYQILFSFSGGIPFVSHPRVYRLNNLDGTEVIIPFLGTLYMTFPTILGPDGNKVWNPREAMYIFLHELGHIPFFDDYMRDVLTTAESERKAHALALRIVSKINRKYPDEGFFDLKACRDISQKWLKTYDPKSDPKSLEKPRTVKEAKNLLRQQASNLRRSEARKMLIDLESRSMKPNLFVETVKILLKAVESFLRQVPSLRRNIPK